MVSFIHGSEDVQNGAFCPSSISSSYTKIVNFGSGNLEFKNYLLVMWL